MWLAKLNSELSWAFTDRALNLVGRSDCKSDITLVVDQYLSIPLSVQ